MAPQAGTINIVDRSVFLVVAVPVSALTGVDDDGDATLSPAELDRHNGDIARAFARRFTVTAEGATGTPQLTWVLPPQTGEAPAATAYVVALQRLVFPAVPRQPVIRTDLFGTAAAERQMTITATARPLTDVAILTPDRPSHRFFGTGIEAFGDFLAIGVTHILGGADHLLFLLTILAASAGWRYWLTIVTGFTAAHSLSIALAASGAVTLPPLFVEIAIAASIMAAALFNLVNTPGRRAMRLPLVIACGLLHGLGLAAALADLSPRAPHRLASLAGFNFGIEVGQLAFLMLAFGIAVLLGRLGFAPDRLRRAVSWAALLGGGAMLVARVA